MKIVAFVCSLLVAGASTFSKFHCNLPSGLGPSFTGVRHARSRPTPPTEFATPSISPRAISDQRTCAQGPRSKLHACHSNLVTSPKGVGSVSSFTGTHISTVMEPAARAHHSKSSSLEMMRHRKRVPKLGKPADQRKALLRALTTEIIRHGRIKTTAVRAKAVRKHVDHMVELGKRGDLHARRQALGWIYDKDLVHALFEAAPERYGERNGGYTRVLRTMPRQGDNAKMAVIELV
ncbi:hypothetical protein THAOC_03655 [Thalassiosira oceanica]|uniref:Large ribosomal subunit protein bL17c n=1 Tax=Thalassiosira oceanica TaxID=159749 RepID=K0TAZ9_THAOC|nr:hypothetical protein THAOC_03655 [Thalassiosira oceanica]|eukprot:EJK74655.1 hypothetical protein THAOC_03655 [Thalassiosira oceanica]